MTVEEVLSLNPFPGLRAFSRGEADRFFGRNKQIEELICRLDEVSFLAVAGSSGCGKSSLVCAGLLNKLERIKTAEGDPVWRCMVMRPGNRPIANLAEQLAPLLGGSAGSEESRRGTLYGRLRLGSLGLVEAVRLARLDSQTRILVVVDQFEEIFRFRRSTDPDEAIAFINLLLHATNDKDYAVSVIITLRSEYLGYCADFRHLPETINRGQYLVPKLTREERKECIVGPVELRGFKVAPRLVQRILNDVPDDFDDLPVMQHVLTLTWRHWANVCQGSRQLDLEDYEAVGTANQALSKHADEAYKSLSGLGRVVERVFRGLTERVAAGKEIRRPLEFNLLCDIVGVDRVQVEQIVNRFRRPDTTFLLPPEDAQLNDNPVIDISHESLIRQWQRLRDWASEEAESRTMLLRLIEAARQYEANQGSLWRGRDLEKAHEWRQSEQPTPAWVGLYTGGDGITALQSVERFLGKSDDDVRWQKRRWKSLVWGVRGLMIAIVVVSVVAVINVSKKRQKSQSSQMANEALLEIDQDPARSAQIALAAVELDPENERAEYALRQSLATLEGAHTEWLYDFKEPVQDARYSKDGSHVVIASGKTAAIFNTGKFGVEEPKIINRDASILTARLIEANKILVTQTIDDQGHSNVQIQKVSEQDMKSISCDGKKNQVFTVSISPDERYIALGCYDGEVLVYNVSAPGRQPQKFTHKLIFPVTVTVLAFSEDNKYLASGDADGVVNIWKLGHPGVWIGKDPSGTRDSPIRHSSAIRDISFHSEDSNLLLTAGDDNQAIEWLLDLEQQQLSPGKNKWQFAHERSVIAAKFAYGKTYAGLDYAVYTVSDKKAQFWRSENAEWDQIRNHEDWVNDASVSTDGKLFATASSDGTARIWSTQFASPVAVLRGHKSDVIRAMISPLGDHVMTASLDNTVRMWKFKAPQLLFLSRKWMLSAAFDPSGNRVVVGGEKGVSILEIGANKFMYAAQELATNTKRDAFSRLSWSRDGKFVVGTGCNHGIESSCQAALWDAERKMEITPDWLKKQLLAKFCPVKDELVTASKKGQVAVWDAVNLTNENINPKLEIAQLESGKQVAILTPTISPDGQWLAAFSGNNVKLWKRSDLQAGPKELQGHDGDIVSLQFSPDSKWLLTASKDRTARIWPVETQGDAKVLTGHTLALSSASFDPMGERIVTGGADGTVRVWDAKTGRQLAAFHRHREGVNDVRFSPDSKEILSASDDGTVLLGGCVTCSLTSDQLGQRVKEFAKLPQDELQKIKADAHE